MTRSEGRRYLEVLPGFSSAWQYPTLRQCRTCPPADTESARCPPGCSGREGDRVEKPDGGSSGDTDDAAAAQVADDGYTRETLADQREAELDAREARADLREVREADRQKRAMRILADAEKRDDQADARDAAATTRDTAASLHSFLHDGEHEHGPAMKARRSAAIDRTDSKTDRHSAATDRSELTEDDSTPPDVDNT
jgi:hypothetical protein